MNYLILAAAFIFAVLPTLHFMPGFIWIVKRNKGVMKVDENKFSKPLVPSIGGVALVTGFMGSLTTIIFISVIFGLDSINLQFLLPALLSITLISLLGLVDDIIIIPKRFTKPLITLYAAVPLMAVQGLNTVIHLPFIGGFDLGIFYNILLIPLALIFCSNAINILSTYNGIETGLGAIVASGMIIVALLKNDFTSALMLSALVGVLLVFYKFNKFPGHVGTLFIGGTIAAAAIIGNSERAFAIMMVPFFLHFLFYSRNFYRFKPNMWGIPQKNGLLLCPYKKAYGLMHWLLLRGKMAEKGVVYRIFAFEAIFVVLAIVLELIKL